jgi:deoxyribodipyrimidine photolyase-related protein
MFILLPNQLFKRINVLKGHDVYMYCHRKFIFASKGSVVPYHYCKVLHLLASMYYYIGYLRDNGIKVIPIYYDSILPSSTNVHIYDPVDIELMTLFKKTYGSELNVYNSPLFIENDTKMYEHYKRHAPFYRVQRIKRGILMNGTQPLYGKWSYDKDNRSAYPKDADALTTLTTLTTSKMGIPRLKPIDNKWTNIAKKYISNDNLLRELYSNANTSILIFPVTHIDAKRALHRFINKSLVMFGNYQDAVHTDIPFGYHSILSALINNGLITANEVMETVLKVKVNKNNVVSIEGFIRQLFWREYIRIKYVSNSKQLIQTIKFKGSKRLNRTVWSSMQHNVPLQGVPLHVSMLLERYRKYGYLTHIERLIFIGSFMLINEIHHKDVYNWYNSFVDAYEWVMVPNVYGMLLYSNLMMSRPYIVSSNYITKMSNVGNGEWREQYDILYRQFVKRHKLKFY